MKLRAEKLYGVFIDVEIRGEVVGEDADGLRFIKVNQVKLSPTTRILGDDVVIWEGDMEGIVRIG